MKVNVVCGIIIFVVVYKTTITDKKLPLTFYSLSSYWFAIQCFLGHAGCNYLPGLRGTAFIVMYVISYVGSGFLIRYDEGATYLAVVQVSTCRAAACVTSHEYIVLILIITLYMAFRMC